MTQKIEKAMAMAVIGYGCCHRVVTISGAERIKPNVGFYTQFALGFFYYFFFGFNVLNFD